MGTYEDVFGASTEDPESFWLTAAEGIDWAATPSRALDSSGAPFYRWFPDGRLSVCFNAVDRHVEAGRGEQPALIHDSPVTGTRHTYTYAQLKDEVALFAGALAQLGVVPGDRVVIYMPMVPEAAVAMLACARIGAVHSVVIGGFAPRELALRIDDAAPKVVVSASCGIEGKRVIAYKPLLDRAIELAVHKPAKTVILQRPQQRAALGPDDLDWAGLVAAASPADCVSVAATDPPLHPLHVRNHRETQGSRA
jgi:propionyl-CoA synthetase